MFEWMCVCVCVCVCVCLWCRLQSMRDNNLMKDGDWMTKKEAMREKLPSHFTNQDIQARLKEVSPHNYVWPSQDPCHV